MVVVACTNVVFRLFDKKQNQHDLKLETCLFMLVTKLQIADRLGFIGFPSLIIMVASQMLWKVITIS